MRKRIVALALALTLVIAMLPTAAFAWDTVPSLTLSTEYVEASNQIIAKVDLGAYTNIAGITLRVTYDKTKVSVASAEQAGVLASLSLGSDNAAGNGFVGVAKTDIEGYSGDAETILTITFNVVDGQYGAADFKRCI